jgi:tungsten cofactor oxidoreducase radical SAM maturase
MPKISMNGRKLQLPQDFLKRRHYPENVEYWLSERNGELILNPCLPDIRKLYLEPTTACNLCCRTCIRNSWGMPEENMARQTFNRVLESLPELPFLKQVFFSGFGEPLSHPSLLDMVERVRTLGLSVTIATNGLLLDREMSAELVRLGVERINVSVDGADPQTFQDIRGVRLGQVSENIEIFNAVKAQLRSLRPSLGLEFVAMRSNVSELGDLTRLGARWNVSHMLVTNILPYTEDMLSEVLYSYQPVEPTKTNYWPIKLDAWLIMATDDLPRMHWGATRRCRFVGDHGMVVGFDGSVAPCLALSHNYSYYTIDGCKKQVSRYSLGNVNQISLADIWMQEEYVRFRSDVKAYHFPSCPDCDLRDTCDLREQNDGCWGWNPSCADCLWSQDIIRCP